MDIFDRGEGEGGGGGALKRNEQLYFLTNCFYIANVFNRS